MRQRNSTPDTTGPGTAQPGRTTSYDAQVDELLDDALDDTFPASDPVAVTPARRRRHVERGRKPA
jgi:hypothetical protein